MIYNDALKQSYGTFIEIEGVSSLIVSKQKPTERDYIEGYFERFFAKKVNDDKIYEVDFLNSKNVSSALYKIVTVKWKISGPRSNLFVNGILNKAGIIEQNTAELDRIKKEDKVDLSSTLPNLLEYWRGY